MDYLDIADCSSHNWNSEILISSAVFVVLIVLWCKNNRKLPPGPYSLPLIGYLPFLGKKPHEKLHELSQKYGNIFRLRLGPQNAVVLADYGAVREAFSQMVTSDRPPAFHFMPGTLGMVSLNGAEWAEQRKYTVRVMKDLGMGKTKWETDAQDEVDDFVSFLLRQNGEPLDIKAPLLASTSNIVLSLLFGYRLPLNDEKRTGLNRGFESFPKFFEQTGLVCLFPVLLEKLGFSPRAKLREDLLAFNHFVRSEIHKSKMESDISNKEAYVSRYLKEIESRRSKGESSFNESSLIGNIQAFLFGGSETMTTTLTWLFLAMASHPEVQQRVHEEVDSILDSSSKPQWSEHSKLPYTYSCLLESMRWRTLTPMNLFHSTGRDTKICGYDIPKNTTIIALLHALHNDKKFWSEPEKFHPERFLDKDGAVIARKESFAPFSMGKRICPGEKVAMIELFLYFTTIMQNFDIVNTDKDEIPNLDTVLSLVLQPTSFKLRFVQRK